MKIDSLLLLMTLIWGTNYALVKSVFRELDPQAFNALRMLLASAVMVATSRVAGAGFIGGRLLARDIFHSPAPITRDDWVRLAWLGLVGHCFYQFLFAGGLARTSVANSALIISSTPIVITVFSSLSKHERPGPLHWAGTLLSLAGIYIVVGRGAEIGGASLRGDLMLFGAVVCWAAYTMGARALMERHSPVGVTALSMLIGTLAYVPLVSSHVAHVPWAEVSATAWIKLVYSSIFALCVSYTIWYAAVREIGSARTAVYSNLLPIVAMATAYLWLHEPIGAAKAVGATAVLAGVALARKGTFHRTMDGP
jgi:drug/metabolite transporter (DMT)-like permease